MNTATAILPAAALCAALLLPVSATAGEAAPETPPTPPGVRAEALDVRNGRSGNLLRGVLYRPEGAEGRLPVVLCAHEFGGDSRRPWWVRYATHLAGEGFAVYAFDFSGGGESSRSEGRTTEMSVMTEADDLESVLDAARGWDFADPARILLVGGSQGGAVSAVVAARRPDDIAALVLLYPAFVIRDDLHKKFASPEDVPDVYRYNGWIDIGPRYVRDMWDFDVYAGMGGFRRPVLLVHGDGDKIVPLAYSERALAAYPDARLVALKADTHVFPQPGVQAQCLAAIDAFLRETGFLPEPPPAAPAVTYIERPVFPGEFDLYEDPDPADVAAEQWYEIAGRGQFVRNVRAPTLIPYLPAKGAGNGAAIVIAPGGAFLHHTFGSGGYEAAEWFRSRGFATFILKYRVEETPREEEAYQAYVREKMAGYIAGGKSGVYAPATPDYAIEDANSAVKLLRSRAAEFGFRPDRIGIVGFSAGALMAVYNAECAPPESRADFIGSIYGQLVLRDMPEKMPPMFAAMSSDDPLSGQSGFEVVQAWQKRGIAELHLYGLGGHNFGMGHEPFTSALWPEQFLAFLRMAGMLKPAD